jgi:hypothetical protein
MVGRVSGCFQALAIRFMQILFISEESQINRFLSGFQAEAMMPQGNVEISGMAEESMVTVICSGASAHYQGTITSINSNYQTPSADGKWLGVKFMVQMNKTGLADNFYPLNLSQ